jgi:hypothetical protein
MDYVEIDEYFRVALGSNFILQKKTIISPRDGSEERIEWKNFGYHGSMVCALKGYVRHSCDPCTTIQQMLAKVDTIESNIKRIKKR